MFMPGIRINGELPIFFPPYYYELWSMPEEVLEKWLQDEVPAKYHEGVRKEYREERDFLYSQVEDDPS